MNYSINENEMQLSLENSSNFLMIPSNLESFNNTTTEIGITNSGRTVYCLNGTITIKDEDRYCSNCGCFMHINDHTNITLRHLCIGGNLSCLSFSNPQFYCPNCKYTKMNSISFKADNHRITKELYQYTIELLACGKYTNKQVAEITGLGKNTVKAIDLKRLKDKYTLDDKLIAPTNIVRFIGIDEFKLHDGNRYATHIIDLETGHILFIAHGKKKQVVYDFINFVGLEWMKNVIAVACDMNSDFEEAFMEKCPHLQIVFDYFHIVKNFNDKVISEVRKDEEKRLREEGNEEAAKLFKRTKYILTSSRKTLQKKDEEARQGKVISKGSTLFNKEEVTRKEGYEKKYDELLKENELLFTADIVKEKLSIAYKRNSEYEMANDIIEIIDICNATDNKHFKWFARLLSNHFEGIIAHATYKISSGKIEGINNKIKTLRRQGYGYPDDEYFFLKLIDMSRTEYVRNVKSHKICD